MAQQRHYTSEFFGICKSNRNGKKKDGSSRMCIDFRKLNQKLVKDKFPLPLIEDVLDTLKEAKKQKMQSYTPCTTCRGKQIQRKKRQHFKIVTDCSASQKTMQKKDIITRIARWVLQLEEFDYEIEHRAGSRMKHVDAVSR
ncbi:transposon Ty3-I Gag-Pol polyprotein [Trichonephila clavipes]|uniref:Transposon Ty3-I Gag-Pol polyprotein n=1 Tax=Trichonephila clavipes TaxID=2585209 RepID=A0A8X7BBD7_TRICX|nr:transposon Ty3-I Gag-Pol polyprotein [Trichonephila clavipes]